MPNPSNEFDVLNDKRDEEAIGRNVENNNKTKLWGLFGFIKLGNRLRLALIALISVGLSLLLISKILEENKLVGSGITHEVGVLFVTITPMLFIYELALRRVFVVEVFIQLEKALNGYFNNQIAQILKQSMPISYDNIISKGIVDAFDELDATHLKERIENARDTEIKMVKMWIPFLSETLRPESIVDSIVKQGCSYKIVICDPACEETIKNRAYAIGYTYNYYAFEITATLEYLQNVWCKLHEAGEEYTKKLEVRAHNYFAAGSLIGFEQYYILGFYLYSNEISTRGMQIKVERGVHIKPSNFFVKLDDHFRKQWDVAYKEVAFAIDKPYELVQRTVKY